MKDDDKTKKQLLKELKEAQKKISELEKLKTVHKQAKEALVKEQYLLQALMENTTDTIYFKDLESRFIRVSRSQVDQLGLSDPKDAIGKSDFDFFEHAQEAYEDEQKIIATGEPLIDKEEAVVWPDGRKSWVSTTKMPLKDKEDKIIGTFGITRDITDRKLAEEKLKQLLEELSTPVLNTWEGIIVMPLIGTLTSDRAQEAMEMLLNSINDYQAKFAIIDITGVPVIDTLVADYLLKTAKAVKILGSETIITGISPEIATILVRIGVEVEQFITRSTLREGLQYAIKIVEGK